MRRIHNTLLILVALFIGPSVGLAADEQTSDKEKSFYGTVIAIDKTAKTLKLIGNDGTMVDMAAEDKAAKHLDQIPLNSLIDIKVEMRDSAPPVIKSWKMAQAQSSCRVFDGRMCAP